MGPHPPRGVWPLAPSFDTVGPIARTVAGLVTGMELLEPGFAVGEAGRCRSRRWAARPRGGPGHHDCARPRAGPGGWDCRDLAVPGWDDATLQAGLLLVVEAWASDATLVRGPRGDQRRRAGAAGVGSAFGEGAVHAAWTAQRTWKAALEQIFTEIDILVTPTLTIFPPRSRRGGRPPGLALHPSRNLAGVPALSLPVPAAGPLPASMQ